MLVLVISQFGDITGRTIKMCQLGCVKLSSHKSTRRKLSDEQVKNLREERKNGEQLKNLSKKYNITSGATRKIVIGLTYKDCQGPIEEYFGKVRNYKKYCNIKIPKYIKVIKKQEALENA